MKELIAIQSELNAPKGQYNKFGGYYYRSCEDILAAVKPLLLKHECTLTLSDEVKEIGSPYHLHQQTRDTKKSEIVEEYEYNGSRFYIEATATLTNKDGETISVKASAREEVVKRGCDGAQISGASSSYARKYALNGLFAIDDVKDADATNTHGKEAAKPAPTPAPARTTRTTRTTAKPASAQPFAPVPKPTAPAPEQPTKEMSDTFVALCVSNITQKDFLAAFKSLLQSNPAFNTDYWKQEANKYYKSLNA